MRPESPGGESYNRHIVPLSLASDDYFSLAALDLGPFRPPVCFLEPYRRQFTTGDKAMRTLFRVTHHLQSFSS